jgi:hypothetical protein
MTFSAIRIGRIECKTWMMLVLGAALVGGCNGTPQLLPNADPNLRKDSVEFAADAAKRTYKADAPRGGEIAGRAQVGSWSDVLEVANLSDTDWEDVEIWVNKKYVLHVPKLEKSSSGKLVHATFYMLFDDSGHHFPTDNRKTRIEKVEIFKDGKMYDIKLQTAD